MSNIKLNVTGITFDKVKNKKLSFYLNGKISNTDKIDNILVSSELANNEFVYGVSENLECVIENSNTAISIMNELKKFHKKSQNESFDEKAIGFENNIKSTYDFIYGVDGENEIEFSKDKLFSGVLISEGKTKVISTNYNSIYYCSENKVNNLFSQENIAAIVEDDAGDEGDYSPSNGVMKSVVIDQLKKNDIFLICTQNVNSKLDEDNLASSLNAELSSEAIAWNIVGEIANKDVDDEIIVLVIKIDHVETIVKTESKAKFPGFFKSDKTKVEDELIEDEDEEEYEETEYEDEEVEDDITDKEKKVKKSTAFNEFTSIKFQNPGKIKPRMNIYLKRLLSIFIIVVLLGGITWGMIELFKKAFDRNDEVDIPSATVQPVITPVVSSTPTPATPTPTPTPEPTPAPVQEVYNSYTVQEGDSLWKINNIYYPNEDHIDEIVAYNDNLTDRNSIAVGQVLKIPILTVTPAPSPAN